jgi:eukaryotic-like serine/threonine-protein kinase
MVRAKILRRLPILGRNHNRFYVGEVFATLVSRITDEDLLMVIRDLFQEDKDAAEWCSPYLDNISLPKAIRDQLR